MLYVGNVTSHSQLQADTTDDRHTHGKMCTNRGGCSHLCTRMRRIRAQPWFCPLFQPGSSVASGTSWGVCMSCAILFGASTSATAGALSPW